MSADTQASLLKQKRFLPFFITQVLGALNDNIFKNALLILIAFRSVEELGVESGLLVNAAAILFILPFFLFSTTFGQFAEKFEKSKSIRLIKLCEIIIVLLAGASLYLDNIGFMLAVLFLLGVQSAAFGPIKYSILPQHLRREELTGGNGLVEMGTFLAILIGTLLGGVLIALEANAILAVTTTLLCVAVAGYIASRSIPMTPATDPNLKINWNPLSQLRTLYQLATQNKAVMQSQLGIAWFWFFGAVILAQIPNYTQFSLGGDESVTTVILAAFSVGVGAGSLICSRLSAGRVEPGIVPIGAFGISLFTLDLYRLYPNADGGATMGALEFLSRGAGVHALIDIVLIGLFGGIFTVPLYAMVQSRTKSKHLSQIVSAGNILNAFFMVLSGVYAIALLSSGYTIPQLLFITALVNIAIACYIFKQVPEFIFRATIWLLIRFIYRVRSENVDRIPLYEPSVIVANHVSFVDALIIAASSKRNIRFVMYHKIFNAPLVGALFKMANAIPIAPASEDVALMNEAFDKISAALDNGDVVCIFPEGKLTSDGEVGQFKRGVERILERNPVMVVPMALRGLWRTWFSRRRGAAMRGLPTYFRGTVELLVGEPIPAAEASAEKLEEIVKQMRGDKR
ncbi:MAG: MFS transporter [Pseudohongiellaceae bacterium]|nr:MFS transporter [Pseudohongiellaceae bacterium]